MLWLLFVTSQPPPQPPPRIVKDLNDNDKGERVVADRDVVELDDAKDVDVEEDVDDDDNNEIGITCRRRRSCLP